MKRIRACIVLLTLVLAFGCAGGRVQEKAQAKKPANLLPATGSEAVILQSWQGDYPVNQLRLLPKGQRENREGFINDATTFRAVWKVFQPGDAVPRIDFTKNLMFFARNIEFYNDIKIVKVTVTDGTAEIIAAETKTARPIEDRVAMSMVMVARKGITAIQIGDKVIPIDG